MEQTNIRGLHFCRACSSTDLFTGIDLGKLPIANELFLKPERYDLFPLHLRICRKCGLGQVADAVSSNRLFRDYRYLSSVSASFLNHAKTFALDAAMSLDWQENDWILEIASNDGYLLKYFIAQGKKVLGVEPASNIAQKAVSAGIPTINEFFNSELASRILAEYGHPRLIVANNVFAHVPDIQDFTKGLSILMDKRTRVSIENPSIMNLLLSLQFDSIYHEHFSYLSATAVAKLISKFGLVISEIDFIETHGGSNRYWLSKEVQDNSKSVATVLDMERNGGLLNDASWNDFSIKVTSLLSGFKDFVTEKQSLGQVVVGYGAAAKASTLINAAKIEKNQITYIVDESPEKMGRFMPAAMIPIVDSMHLLEKTPDHIVIFPWNLASEIAMKIKTRCGPKVHIWRAIPKLEELK